MHLLISFTPQLVSTFVLFPISGTPTLNVDSRFTPEAIAALKEQPQSNDSAIVPRIIHQVKLGGLKMKPTWTAARQSCLKTHPQWEFKLWEDKEGDEFVKEQYPQIFDHYRGYKLGELHSLESCTCSLTNVYLLPAEIQRANILRYLVLDHYGGMYLDLDLRCLQPLDPMRNESLVTPPANPTGINNAFIVSSPHHPFWKHVVEAIPRYDLGWFNSPYLTNMFSTGCHFLSTIHRQMPYSERKSSNVKILDQKHKLNGHVTTPLFEHLGASSWHKGDAKMVLMLGKCVEFLKLAWPVTLLLAVLVVGCCIAIRVVRRNARANSIKYSPVAGDVEGDPADSEEMQSLL